MNESDFSILLVDDDELVLLSLELILSDKGYRVFNTSHSENILEIIEREKIDLIVLDYYLYGVNGVEILSKIRSVELFAHIPILMLTSEESPDII
ncbi:MAG TPA: response regulator, partial [Leptospiraceae bacterium]|nr:response regulator [Leptospiraceae bacterium]